MQSNENRSSNASLPRSNEKFILVWLDSNINEFNHDHQSYIAEYRNIVSIIKTFSNANECVNFLTNIEVEKVLLIVSSTLGQQIIPIIHDMTQLYSIYVFCEHESNDSMWTNQWTKVKGIFTKIEPIYNSLKQDTNQCEHNLSLTNIVSPENHIKQDLNELESSVMYREAVKKLFTSPETDANEGRSSKFSPSRLVQNFVLIWLDSTINESNEDFHHPISRLRLVANTIKTFSDADECVDYLTNITDDKVFLIVSGIYGEQLVSLIHEIPQLYSVYLFYSDKNNHHILANEKTKIKGVFTQIEPICNSLQLDTRQCDHDLISVSIVSSGELAKHDLDELEPLFMYSQILKEILLDIEHSEHAKEQLVQLWREQYWDNEGRLRIIDEFQRDYHLHSPIWWYTRDCFIYQVLNQAVRTMDIGMVIKMGFFLRDIHRQIKKLYDQQSDTGSYITVYRGQAMLNSEFEKLRNNKGGLLSFNNFLSTSVDPQVSLMFCPDPQYDSDITAILFEMKIDPVLSSTSFAFLENVSNFSNEEQEMLFSMHTVFRIGAMMEIEERRWRVQLTLTSDNDEQLNLLTKHIREETVGFTEWDRLGRLMIRMGEWDKAEEVYRISLDMFSESDKLQLAFHYHQLGLIRLNRHDSQGALESYQKALQIKQSVLSSNDPSLATTYNNIGGVYESMGDYSSALVFHQKALEIEQNSLPHDHLSLSFTNKNIGMVYKEMGDSARALLFYQKALEIQQKCLPPNHPYLAVTYSQIGETHQNMKDYSGALLFYEKVLEIQRKVLPPKHPSLSGSYTNIGQLYDTLGDYANALLFHQKALDEKRKILPADHLDFAVTYSNIRDVYLHMEDYSSALSFDQKALQIKQKSLSSDHLDLAISYNNIAEVYRHMGDYLNALILFQKSLEIRQKSLPSNSPKLAVAYGNMGLIHDHMGNYLVALSFYEKELEIEQKSLSPTHPDLAITYNNIGAAHASMDNYSAALKFFHKALEIQEKSLPSNHRDLASTYHNIGALTQQMGDHTSALSFYQRAFEIRRKSLPPNSPSLAISYKSMGKVYNKMGEYVTALEYHQKALDIEQKSLSSEHPDLADTYKEIGTVHSKLKDWPNALSFYQKALEIQQKNFSISNPDLAMTYNEIGIVHHSTGDYSNALLFFDKALEIQQKSPSPNHPNMASINNNLGALHHQMGDYYKALSFLERAVEIGKHSMPANHPSLQSYLVSMNYVREKLYGKEQQS